ncbi:outer membrane protein [Sphingomonas sp. M1-B02]|uniref:outer membrane protein n=1 Tax=Sphingomonas sp. M1-B02 TaxID=3114300 RepID=UPI002240AAB5|nr:outer membrane beta-barrel protein [Sphingomonas sp. S6-11]UZK65619.1 outer membrane beta-barrel protein [Sphingomonas sp. S6-11]
MRKTLLAASALAAATLFSAPAFAQDSAPGGFRVGVIGGLDIVRPGDSEDSRVRGDDQSIEGALYGIEAGYDIPLGGAILGIEGEFSGSTAKVTTDSSDPNFFGYGRVKAGRDLYVGARLGFEAASGTLVYAKGGYTNARLDVTADNGTSTRDENFQLDGWRLGAGVEKSIGTNTYAKLEYRYSNYTNADFQFANGAVTDTFDIDTDRHQIVAGVGFRF